MGNKQSSQIDIHHLVDFGVQNSMLTANADTQAQGNAYFESLKRRSLLEYPWLADVKESMLVTDATLPDCPIIFANDLFEKMSLYPKESILGKNCRFLQGPFTKKETVKKIREAVDGGHELEVEILNYRKDGTPFMNNFLMVPIHTTPKKRKGKVTHFIAIQKDISLLASDESPIVQWDATKMAIIVHEKGFEQVAKLVIENGITGQQFLLLSQHDLLKLGVRNRGERQELCRWIEELNENQAEALSFLEEKRGDTKYEYSPSSLTLSNCPNLDEPRQLDYWETAENKSSSLLDTRMAVKCYWFQSDVQKSIEVFTLPQKCNFDMLRARMADFYGVTMVAKYKDEAGDLIVLNDDEDFQEYKSQYNVHETMILFVSPDVDTLQTLHDGLQSLPFPYFLVNSSNRVVYANFAAEELCQKKNLVGKRLRKCIHVNRETLKEVDKSSAGVPATLDLSDDPVEAVVSKNLVNPVRQFYGVTVVTVSNSLRRA